jgi:hypothetical protein
MNSPFHPMVRKTLNRVVNSWERASACGHSGALPELAYRAPHAPCESQSRFAFGELRAKFRRTTSDRDALERLRLRTSDLNNSAVKAASRVSKRPYTTASEHVHKYQVPGRMWNDRVAEVNCAARNRRRLGTVECLRQTVPQCEIRAQLRFESSANDPLSRVTRTTIARPIQHTILIHRLVEPGNLPSPAAERPRLGGTGSHEITPPRR